MPQTSSWVKYRNVNLSIQNKDLLGTIQQKYAPSEAQSHCANNTAASAFMTRVQNTRRGASSSPRVWTLISKQPDVERKMLNIYFDMVHWHLAGAAWKDTREKSTISEVIIRPERTGMTQKTKQFRLFYYRADSFTGSVSVVSLKCQRSSIKNQIQVARQFLLSALYAMELYLWQHSICFQDTFSHRQSWGILFHPVGKGSSPAFIFFHFIFIIYEKR